MYTENINWFNKGLKLPIIIPVTYNMDITHVTDNVITDIDREYCHTFGVDVK